MKSILKRSLSFLLAITLVFSSAYVGLGEVDFDSIFAVKAEAANSGKCGKNLTWTLDNAGKLTIDGTGGMYDYDTWDSKAPWYPSNKNIKTVVIKNGVTSIGEMSFRNCSSLTSITIPDSVTSVGFRAFEECRSLESVYITDLASWCGIEFGFGGNPLCHAKNLYINGKLATNIVIPNSVTSINSYAFQGYTRLKSVVIPNSVTSMGFSAFDGCTSLGSVTISNRLTSIDSSVFSNCKSLKSVVIPNNVKSIGVSAFDGCTSLASVTIGNGVTSIGAYAFCRCTSLKYVFYSGSKSQWNAIGYNEFENVIIHYNATGHVSSTWIIDKKATVNSTGLKHKVCKVCGAKFASTVIPQLKPATPKLSAVTNTVSGVKFTWGKVTGADSYVVYRRTYNPSTKKWGGWVNLAKGIKTTYYVDKTTKSGVYYIYTVKAANEAGYSGFNTTGLKTFFLSTPKLSSVTNSSAGVTVKWGKVAGATNYVVYRKAYNPTTKKWGDWVNVAKGVKTNSYVDKTAKSGVYYIYTVRALAGTNMGSYNTTGLKTYFLSTPVLSKATSTTSGVKFTWGKTAGANGYIVYRRTYNASTKKWNGWSKLATLAGNSKVSYVDKSAKKGVYYIYTTKACCGSYTSAYNTTGLKVKDIY